MNARTRPDLETTHQRIAAPALYLEVADRLRERIFAHELPPGSWIDEQRLAETFGISRTPLREALKVLAGEGLVTLKPRRGCYVTEIFPRDLDEIFPILALLEGRCGFEATCKLDAKGLKKLEALHATLEARAARGDINGFFETNQTFHRAIQELAGNRRLTQIIDDMRKVLKLARHHSLLEEGRLERSLAEHREIMEAIVKRDARRVESLMHQHLLNGGEATRKILAGQLQTTEV